MGRIELALDCFGFELDCGAMVTATEARCLRCPRAMRECSHAVGTGTRSLEGGNGSSALGFQILCSAQYYCLAIAPNVRACNWASRMAHATCDIAKQWSLFGKQCACRSAHVVNFLIKVCASRRPGGQLVGKNARVDALRYATSWSKCARRGAQVVNLFVKMRRRRTQVSCREV